LATAPKSLPGFVEQSLVLPQRLWNRVEQFASDTAREPSEVVAEALRLLITGAAPTGSTAVSGLVAIADLAEEAADPSPIAVSGSGSIELQLADVHEEAPDSDKLLERVTQVMASVDKRDGFTGSHSRIVADLALELGEAAGVSGTDRVELEIAALLHDLGKMRIPEEILGKRGRLTAEEWALVKKYPEFGVEMLRPFTKLTGVSDIVGSHQERWDGSGYPQGLKGDAVPLAAQIIGLCDVYAVLTSERSYRPALDEDTARETIESGTDRLWNPELVRQLLDLKS
jgi:putative nucleotidyltransferase with HDIG domain